MDSTQAQQSLFTSLTRGALSRCPNCGKGRVFTSFLKVAPSCTHCGQELHHHRADDMPAYCVVVLIGHIIVPVMLWSLARYNWPDWVHLALWIPACVLLAILLIQPVKGIIIALQWDIGMHGFAESKAKANHMKTIDKTNG
jgi:uncharacterized protein (DUF983 family)